MKRLLAAGSGDIYQICKVFRAGEAGRLHNPEFTLAEWYRISFDHFQLMDEVEALMRVLLPELAPVSERITYREAFERHAGFDPFKADAARFRECLDASGIVIDADRWSAGDLSDLVAGEIVYPRLGHVGLCFVYDYPASQAALARVRRGPPAVAERFELFYRGMELANGFHELADAGEQQRRFEADLAQRQARGRPRVPIDARLLAALEYGLPDCAGVALGFDRVAMLAANADSLNEVLTFPADRA
jgi:lysyl-tRNA synthetase class 2